jgi:hypothetical protein
MMEVEDILLHLMKRHLSLQPVPLSAPSLIQRKNSSIITSTFLTMRRTEADTLSSLAKRFSLTEGEIVALNNLETEAIQSGLVNINRVLHANLPELSD